MDTGPDKKEPDGDGAKTADLHAINQKISNRSKIVTSLVAGAIAGAIAKTTIAPLDRTKINFQISSDKKYSFRGAVRFLYKSFKNDGVMSLWRGNSATMARIIPHAAVQYAAHEQWKHILNPTNDRNLPPLRRYIAGSLAGATAITVTYPLDLARARMAVTSASTCKNITTVFMDIHKSRNWGTLYRGYTPTLLGVLPYAGTSFFTYETLKKIYHERTGEQEPHPLQRLCFGAAAGLFGQSSSYPLDIARRRMQTAGVTGNEAVYSDIVSTMRFVYRTEGLRGWYKGLSMNWIKGPIAVGISFTVFDLVQREIRILVFHDKPS